MFPGVIQSCVHTEVSWVIITSKQLKVHVTSFKRISSRDRIHIVASGPREGAGVLSIIQIVKRSFGLLPLPALVV